MKLYSYAYQSGKADPLFAAKEAYRTVRANLMFSVAHSGCKRLIFASSVQGEGKTTTVVNVAFSLARSQKKVLLIDLDMRRPRIHRLLKLSLNPGMTNLLSGFAKPEEILHRQVYPNLDVITAGTLSPNPSEMLASEGMEELLKAVGDSYDFVLLDTPPINVVSDALPLIKHTDGVVLVVRPKYSARKEIQKAIEQVQFAGGKVLGAVVNGASNQKKNFGHYKNNHYQTSYGDAVPSEQPLKEDKAKQ